MVSLSQFIPRVPEPIKGLLELALDLRFSWSRTADHIWKRLSPELWSLTHNPWLVLQASSEAKLKELADNPSFCDTLRSLIEAEQKSREAPRWYQRNHGSAPLNAVAYFSMEFGISEGVIGDEHAMIAVPMPTPQQDQGSAHLGVVAPHDWHGYRVFVPMTLFCQMTPICRSNVIRSSNSLSTSDIQLPIGSPHATKQENPCTNCVRPLPPSAGTIIATIITAASTSPCT